MAHPRARLNVLGRELLVTRVAVLGWPVATAAEAQGISRATGYKWVRRFRAEGGAGLLDRSSWPHRSPRATPLAEVERILTARSEWRWGPDRLGPLLGHPASTVAAILHRSGVPAWPTSTGRPASRSGATRPAIREPSSTRTTRSSGASPTAVVTGFMAARRRSGAGSSALAPTTSRSSSTTAAGRASSFRSPTRAPPAPRPRSSSPW